MVGGPMTTYSAVFRRTSGRRLELEVNISAPTLALARVAAERYAASCSDLEVADVREIPHTLMINSASDVWVSHFGDDDWEALS